MSNQPFALQLYSLRAESALDFPATLRSVAQLGFQGVEFAGYHGHSAEDLKKILDETGLKAAGTHTSLDSVSDQNLAETAAFNATLGNPYLIVPGVGKEYQGTRDGALRLAEKLSQAAKTAAEYGAFVGYHNHSWEFQPVNESGDFPMEILATNTPPEVILQVDTGNCKDGGGDPIAFLDKWKSRVVTVHLKPSTPDFPRYFIGEDDTDWNGVFGAINADVTRHYIIEHERYPEPLTPSECAARDLKFLRDLGK